MNVFSCMDTIYMWMPPIKGTLSIQTARHIEEI
nr:MAG TPA: hypothetical protein [Caudoviricetes sp.]